MNWYKAKTILIVFFIIMNSVLLGNLIYSADKATVITPEIIDATINILENNNIKIDKSIIPIKTYDIPYAEVRNIIQDYDLFVGKFFNEYIKSEDNMTYQNENQTILFYGDKFSYSLKNPDASFETTSLSDSNAIEIAKKICEFYDFDISHALTSISLSDDMFYVTVVNTINKKPIFDSTLVITLCKDGLVSINGSWFEENDSQLIKTKLSLKSVTGVLVDFILEPNRPEYTNEITNLQLGYSTYEAETFHKTIALIPTWQISLNDGSTYYLDTRDN